MTNLTFAKWSLRYDAAGDSGRWSIEDLRLHFGERTVSSMNVSSDDTLTIHDWSYLGVPVCRAEDDLNTPSTFS
ncbi:hypothetical protein PsorP6_002732 [Peronosclerospora sorghi]|uniref:Uncharacterized protein n=1 Tax=Peronosclerospora sorghi TaxID=230839 RepID=A0ACC0WXG1_9STRA|nr:hypothetical protein PsorP6_002732 [Peronosclerospora sorghi]